VPPPTSTTTTTDATPSLVLPPPPSTSSSLPREATVRPLNPPDIPALKRIFSLLLPVPYPEAFYATALASPFSRLITWSDTGSQADAQVIGGIVCRLEPVADSPQHVLYIQALALLSPFRAHGLASAALADIIALAAASRSLDIALVYAHVWTENEDGLRWYAARDFVRDALPIPGYYLKLRPNTAYVVRRDLSPLVLSPSNRPNASLPVADTAMAPLLSATAAAANLPPFAGPPRSSSPPTQNPASTSTPNLARPAPPSRTVSAQSTQTQGQSFQNKRADMEWNDLPSTMLTPGSGPNSEASSRSSSTVRKKKERKYAAAAFGS
jgi:N-alpha-acetyltransferase 50